MSGKSAAKRKMGGGVSSQENDDGRCVHQEDQLINE